MYYSGANLLLAQKVCVALGYIRPCLFAINLYFTSSYQASLQYCQPFFRLKAKWAVSCRPFFVWDWKNIYPILGCGSVDVMPLDFGSILAGVTSPPIAFSRARFLAFSAV